ncbi:MAG: glycosyltransferase family 4 protein [Candidatus Eisenbacteria bacterium]|nr:glycosyltransferase family 4 protein [Candidatus Eisenbacteria bacterium]
MSERVPVLVLSPWPSFWEGAPGVGCSDEDEVHRGLVRAGFDVHFVMPASPGVAPPGPPSHFHLGPDVLSWGGALPSGLRRPLRYFSYRAVYGRRARVLGEQIRPRLVVGHSYHAARAAVATARALGARSVTKFFGVMTLACEDPPAWIHRARHWEMIHALRAPADRVVVMDDGTHGDRAALRHGVPADRLRFWPNGLDTGFRDRVPRRTRAELCAAAGVPGEEVLALMINRLVDNKRVDLAVDAVARLDPALRVRLVVVGEGPLRAALQERARAAGARVSFLGALPHDDLFEWLRAADVFVGTSVLTNRSLTTLEAMMCGLPVVAVDAGGTRDVVVPGTHGWLAAADPAALAVALERMAREPERRRAMGRAAFEASAAFPGWEERVAREVGLYFELLGAR